MGLLLDTSSPSDHAPSPGFPISSDWNQFGEIFRLLPLPLSKSSEAHSNGHRNTEPPHALRAGAIVDNTETLDLDRTSRCRCRSMTWQI